MITRTNLNNIQRTGRLCNQLWVIASAMGIAKDNDMELKLPEWKYQKYFKGVGKLCDDSIFHSNERFVYYHEPDTYYHKVKLDKNYHYDLDGYFQSYKYFQEYKNYILDLFESACWDCYTNYSGLKFFGYYPRVAVHVRRGDYLNLSNHPVLDKEYYLSAMEEFTGWMPESRFIVFSDDMPWCMENLTGSNIYHHEKQSDILDWFSMRTCNHFIIANSSYSWWAAYLEHSPSNFVIAPKVWVLGEDRDDRVPLDWIRL